MPIRLTASKSSIIAKPSRARYDAPLLPSEALYLKNLNETRQMKQKTARNKQEKLESLGPISFDIGPKSNSKDLLEIIDYIQSIMWTEIPDKGLGKDLFAEIHNYRWAIPPLVSLTHLQAIFPNDTTFIDREVAKKCQQGKVRKLVINIVKGGEFIIKTDDYNKLVKVAIDNCQDYCEKQIFEDFQALLDKERLSVVLEAQDLVKFNLLLGERRDLLLSSGFLTFLPGRTDAFNISVPNLGMYLKLISGSRQWVIKSLEKMKWKELLEDALVEKLESSTKTQWRDLKGCTMDWILLDCYGGGHCEPFSTPVGRGWNLVRNRFSKRRK